MKYALLAHFFLMIGISSAQTSFVQTDGNQFVHQGKYYYFLGTNFWYGMNLGSSGEGGDRQRLIRELDRLSALGVNNLRIIAGSEGPNTQPWRMVPALQAAPGQYEEDLLAGLDFLLDEMRKRDMLAVLCLNNFWPWSGGMAQYVAWQNNKAIPYPPPAENGNWASYQLFAASFFRNEAAMQAFEAHIRFLLQRVNSINQIPYRDDPTIMAWELANEPRGIQNPRAYRAWVQRTASLIKSLDPNHLLTIGSEGWTPSRFAGNHFKKDHAFAEIDYTTLHIWVQNWGWYRPDQAEQSYDKALKKARKYLRKHVRQSQSLGKPIVLEEFGIARDADDHDPAASTAYRDRYYADMFKEVYELARKGKALAGSNFWAWAGEGRPREAKAVWQAGDDFIGDPPHEYQGWYSVYDADESTKAIIQMYARNMAALSAKE